MEYVVDEFLLNMFLTIIITQNKLYKTYIKVSSTEKHADLYNAF